MPANRLISISIVNFQIMALKDKSNVLRVLAPSQVPNLPKSGVQKSGLKLLELGEFKVLPCRVMQQHNHKHCGFYHSYKDKRRVSGYSADLCPMADNCARGDSCPKAHNRVEQLYHPDKYKTKFCTQYPDKLDGCDYAQYCSFAHSDQEIKLPLIHHMKRDHSFYMYQFKTVWCPFIATHDKALCVYAHNWQDYRRNPNDSPYEAVACGRWKAGTFILSYEQGGCRDMTECKNCHGWKELEYHPGEYKTKPCAAGINCTRQPDCPYYHSPKDSRCGSRPVQPPPGFDSTEDKENLSFPPPVLPSLPSLPPPPLVSEDDYDIFSDIATYVGHKPVATQDLSLFHLPPEPSQLSIRLHIDEYAVPSRLLCPLTGRIMHDPVVFPEDGRTYEYSALVKVLGGRGEPLKRNEQVWREIAEVTSSWM